MKRALIVSGDRAWTASVAAAPDPGIAQEWEVARAHSGLEAFVLVDRGDRPIDALVIDTPLPDQSALALMNRLRRSPASADLAVYLLVEPGGDAHGRKAAIDAFRTTRFLDKPVDRRALWDVLAGVTAPLTVLVADGRPAMKDRYAAALAGAGYRVEGFVTGREAVERQPRLRPSAVIAHLQLPDMTGLAMSDHMRRAAARPSPKIVLYGALNAWTAQTAHREDPTDDFVPAPFDDELLVDRIAALVGRTRSRRWRRRSSLPATEDLKPSHRGRLELSGPDGVSLETDRFEVSADGVFVELEDPMPVGTRVALRIDLADDQPTLRADAQVAWISYTGPRRGCGLRLSDLEAAQAVRLEDFAAARGRPSNTT